MHRKNQSALNSEMQDGTEVSFGRLAVGQKFCNDAYTWEKVSETTAAIIFVNKLGDPKMGRPMRYFPEEMVRLIEDS